MSDFTDGQKAIINSQINDVLTEKLIEIRQQSATVANEQIEIHEKTKPRIWQRKDSLGIFFVCLFFALAFLYDRDEGRLYLHSILHNVIGTTKIVNREIKNKGSDLHNQLISHLNTNIADDQSELNKHISTSFSNLIELGDASHPIQRAVRKILNDNPVLVFQSDEIFGEFQSVFVTNQACAQRYFQNDKEPTSFEDLKNKHQDLTIEDKDNFENECISEGVLPGKQELNIPFYANFYRKNGEIGHEVHLLLKVVRTTTREEKRLNYKSSLELNGLNIELIRTTGDDAAVLYNQPGGDNHIEITNNIKAVQPSGNGLFYADLGEIYRRYFQYDKGGNLFPHFLHTLSINVSEQHLQKVDEIIGINALILVNRMPSQRDSL